MAIAHTPSKKVITPVVGSPENNLDNGVDVSTIPPSLVITTTKVVDTELVNDPNPWRETSAVRENNTLTHVTGAPWTVDYLKSHSGKGDISDVITNDSLAINQQFLRYNDLVIKVQSALTPTTDPETQVTVLTGTAIVENILVPTRGDGLIVPMDHGTFGLLTVTSAVPLSILRGRAYSIEYSVSSLDQDFIKSLSNKVAMTYYCRSLGRSDITVALTSAQVEAVINSQRIIQQATTEYTQEFYNHDCFSYTVKVNDLVHHDPLVSRFIEYSMGNTHHVERYLDLVEVHTDIYTSILNQQLPVASKLDLNINVELGQAGVRPDLSRINYSGIKSTVLVDTSLAASVILYSVKVEKTKFKLSDHWESTVAVVDSILPNPKLNSTYLFNSDWFDTPSSLLEVEMKKHLNNKRMDVEVLMTALQYLRESATSHERYYYMPIVLHLVRLYYGKYGNH